MFSHSRGPGARASGRAEAALPPLGGGSLGRGPPATHEQVWEGRGRRAARGGAGGDRRWARPGDPTELRAAGNPARRARAQAAGPPRRAARAALRTFGARAPLAAGGNAPASGPRRPTGRGRRAKGGWGAGGGRTGVAAAAGPARPARVPAGPRAPTGSRLARLAERDPGRRGGGGEHKMAGTWPQFPGRRRRRRRRLPALGGTRDRPARGDAAERAAGGWGAAPAQDADPAFLLSPGADLSLLQEDLPEDADGREWLAG